MQTVCPLPPQWHDIYQRLLAAWETSGRDGVAPPKPLILAAWTARCSTPRGRIYGDPVGRIFDRFAIVRG